ncbi:MAG: nucleotidyltransferase family protein [Clostridia bacterium]
MQIGCILMAAGNATRFGENKLAAEYQGKPLFVHALDAIPDEELYRVVVVTQYDEIRLVAEARGYKTVINRSPEDGISHTIHLGMDELMEADAIMFLVADQPRLRRESVRREVQFFCDHKDSIVAMGKDKRRGNPAIFPKEFFQMLRELDEDAGGSEVIRKCADKLLLYQLKDEVEMFDVDSVKELEELRAR